MNVAIIIAGGVGSRMQMDIPKQFIHIYGKPVIIYTLEGFQRHPEIDARYLQNDIVATAFEIFEKMNSFDAAIELLLEVIGVRYQLDRITIIRTDIKAKTTGRQYQWTSARAPEVLQKPGSFTKEDFLTLFHSSTNMGRQSFNMIIWKCIPRMRLIC